MPASIRADLLVGAGYGLALSALVWTVSLSPPAPTPALLLVVALAVAAGSVRPRVRRLGRVDPGYPALLAALLAFGAGASLLVGAAAFLGGTCFTGRGTPGQRARRTAVDGAGLLLAATVAAASYLAAGGAMGWDRSFHPGALAAHALAYALVRVGCARAGSRLLERRAPAVATWKSFARIVPACLLGAAVADGFARAYAVAGQRLLAVTAAVALLTLALHRSHRSRGDQAARHRRESGDVFRAVARALARAMEAKDEGTQAHLRRVQRMCDSLALRMELGFREREALTAASLLHDIGKLAVPEGILTKPGKLTRDEMERVKEHPGVGADILREIPFPFPLAAIVRHHHERWDGGGYPAGLSGEAIPLGARILSVVDTFDALTSDRPYRKALPTAEAVSFLLRESGKMFDPGVVDALLEHLEQEGEPETWTPVPVDSVPRNPAQDAEPLREAPVPVGMRAEEPTTGPRLPGAQVELTTFYDISRAADYPMNFDEYMMLVGCRLGSIVPHRSLVAYLLDREDGLLRAAFATGMASDKLRLTTIPLGERISGWAALQQRAMIAQDHMSPLERDGSRSDLEDWDDDPEMRSLSATLAAPLVVGGENIGVLTLYDHDGRAFNADDRRALVRVAGDVARAALRAGGRPSAAEASLTDPLTGVPNARFLWLETAHRMSQPPEICPGFGVVAFRIEGLEHIGERMGNEVADRLLCQVARRFAASCEESETLVRFGQDVFIVLTPVVQSGELVGRWHDLAAAVEHPPLMAGDGVVHGLHLAAAHAAYPDNGRELKALLEVLDARLEDVLEPGRTIVPFRQPRSAGAGGARPA